MALNFGKLNFSTSFNPTAAFPLDARYYFESLADAQNAAAQAEVAGSSNTVYYFGEQVVVVDIKDGQADSVNLYLIYPNKNKVNPTDPNGILVQSGSAQNIVYNSVEHSLYAKDVEGNLILIHTFSELADTNKTSLIADLEHTFIKEGVTLDAELITGTENEYELVVTAVTPIQD